jgi:hypothetical protein
MHVRGFENQFLLRQRCAGRDGQQAGRNESGDVFHGGDPSQDS